MLQMRPNAWAIDPSINGWINHRPLLHAQDSVCSTSESSTETIDGTVTLDELKLCHREDGVPFLLGSGQFGQVSEAYASHAAAAWT